MEGLIMGIYLDKYFGYMLDVTEEYSKLCDENDDDILFDKYISCKLEQLDDNLKELGFVPYYFERKHREGDIVLIDDGMCGEYSKIVYVKQAEKYCNDESDVSIENEFFKRGISDCICYFGRSRYVCSKFSEKIEECSREGRICNEYSE